jgi:hypothetical protein
MIIKTTINVRTDNCALLDLAASITGLPRRTIISMIMVRLAENHDILPCQWKRIRYQAREQRGRYKRLHLSLQEPEYELYLDLKKFCKQSVSRLIACAIDMYLDDLIRNVNQDNKKYPLEKYSMNKTIIKGEICWLLQWGIPANPDRYKNHIT